MKLTVKEVLEECIQLRINENLLKLVFCDYFEIDLSLKHNPKFKVSVFEFGKGALYQYLLGVHCRDVFNIHTNSIFPLSNKVLRAMKSESIDCYISVGSFRHSFGIKFNL